MQKLVAFLEKLGLKTEERSILIGFYTTRITWAFLTIILLVWSLQGLISTGRLGMQAVVFFASQAFYWLAYLHYRKKFGG